MSGPEESDRPSLYQMVEELYEAEAAKTRLENRKTELWLDDIRDATLQRLKGGVEFGVSLMLGHFSIVVGVFAVAQAVDEVPLWITLVPVIGFVVMMILTIIGLCKLVHAHRNRPD